MEYRILKLNQLIQGWGNYFKIGAIIKYSQQMDSHIRRRLRACRWKEWKKTQTKYRNLKKLGIKANEAWKVSNSRKGYWRLSLNPTIHVSLDKTYWENQGLKSLFSIIS